LQYHITKLIVYKVKLDLNVFFNVILDSFEYLWGHYLS